jgi:hypothetical protein
MLQTQSIDGAMKSAAEDAKASTQLQGENQSTPYSGHMSAPEGRPMDQAAAGPGAGSPGK